ncbi:MAG: hypothetical protein HY340_00490 [Candidatus Kerfeldbacteria bacterium]|nr:hypothetical protein [Candidatus Kerfeldbacteria bacterium]
MYSWQCSLMPDDRFVTLEPDTGEEYRIELWGSTTDMRFSASEFTPSKKKLLGDLLTTRLNQSRRAYSIKIPARLLWHMSHAIDILFEREIRALSRPLNIGLVALENRGDQASGIAYFLEALIDSTPSLGVMLDKRSARLLFSLASGSNEQTKISIYWDHPSEHPVFPPFFAAQTKRVTPTPQPA